MSIGLFIFWLALSYLCGALPWSVWLGKGIFGVDPRAQPDRNPGAANAFRAAGWRLGAVVLALDFLKACVPVAAAQWLAGFQGEQLMWIALMPTVGHAFSIFLRFRGGRGITVMFGVWAGLILYHIPLVMGLTALAATAALKRDEARSLSIPLVLIAYLLLTHAPGWMVFLASAQLAVLALKIGVYLAQRRALERTSAESGAG
jgi:acyl phosphate:glycerol-3-phosphate acyltransferase